MAANAAAIDDLVDAFEVHWDEVRVDQMSAYMKRRFDFVGLPTPERRSLSRPFLATMRGATADDLLDTAQALWKLDGREYTYVAADLLRANSTQLGPTSLDRLQALVRTDSWWDSVDAIAKPIGEIVRRNSSGRELMDRWAAHDDFWVQRVALIHQLGWRADADPAQLFGYCASMAGESEFFIRKAIGWALRDLARTFPDEVLDFVARTPTLSPLSVREATKHL